jgi:hypothetical protein
MFGSEDRTNKCSQSRTSTTNTSGLLSDANGTLSFDFYYDAGIDEATSDLEQQNRLASGVAGAKIFSVESYDNNSRATGTISLKYYTNLVLTNSNELNVTTTTTGSSTDAVVTGTNVGIGIDAQQINDAQERNNIRRVFLEDYNVQLD